jgi:hypothetical protein
MAQQMFTPMQQQSPQQPAAPPQSVASTPPTPSGDANDPVATLRRLREMLDLGLIEQAEYDAKKAEILSQM